MFRCVGQSGSGPLMSNVRQRRVNPVFCKHRSATKGREGTATNCARCPPASSRLVRFALRDHRNPLDSPWSVSNRFLPRSALALPGGTEIQALRERVATLALLAKNLNVLPNPSIEPTSTGWARYALYSFSASRAHPVPAPHVKR
jgi:hypothetical protein